MSEREGVRPPPWDTSRMATVRCDVVNVTGAGPQVQVHFGRRTARADGAVAVDAVQTMELTPYAAKRLQDLLAVLVRTHDAR